MLLYRHSVRRKPDSPLRDRHRDTQNLIFILRIRRERI